MRLLMIITVLLVTGCDERKVTYIETEHGLVSFHRGYCEIGMLISNNGANIRDENNKPITCSGYVKLTDAQVKEKQR